jgi:hypothetical protein
VLSNDKLVKVIEDHFTPVAIYNNTRGDEDAKVRKKFKEPAWNYQVVRFLDAEGKDLIPRKDRVWSLKPLAKRMITALEKAKRPVPESLQTLAGR